MYCSKVCIKRAWYLKRHPNCYYGKDNKEFWKSATGKGFTWEKYVAKLLGAEHKEFNYNTDGADLIWNGKTVDVKSANAYYRKSKRGVPVKGKQTGVWVFHFGAKRPDYIFFVCLIKDKVFKMYLIPASEIKATNGCTFGKISVYDKFLYS